LAQVVLGVDEISGEQYAVDNVVPDCFEGGGFADAEGFDAKVYGDNVFYEDERAVESDDDRPMEELSAREIEALKKVLTDCDPLIPEFRDLSESDRAVVYGLLDDVHVPSPSEANLIEVGLVFPKMDELKVWLQEYSIAHNRPTCYGVLSSEEVFHCQV